MSVRLQNVLLFLLAVVTAVIIGVALGSVESTRGRSAEPPGGGIGAGTAQGTDPTGSTAGDDGQQQSIGEAAAAASAEPPEGGDPAAQTAEPEAEAEPAAPEEGAETAAPEEDAEPAEASPEISLAAAIQGADDDAVSVAVLGDDTSSARDEWVQVWGQLVADQRPVRVVHWDEEGDVSFTEPDVLSESGDGTPLTIWSTSRTGADVDVTTERLAELLPPEGDADAVIINLGTNDAPDEIAGDLDALLEAVRAEVGNVPVGLVRQGLPGASAETMEAAEAWAADQEGVTVLDLSGEVGPELWAQAVVDQLAP